MAGKRLDWVDTAKGIAICLVAIAHSVQWTTLTGLAPDWWNTLNLLLVPFRMPLFFLAAGLFAGQIIKRSWPELWRTRLSLLVWCLLLWTVIRFVYFTLIPNPTGMDETNLVELALSPVRPSNGLWFLYALALFFVILKLLRNRVDYRIQLVGAAVISVLFFARFDTGNIAWNGMGRYFLFFVFGCYCRELVMRFVERRHLPTGIVLGVAFVALCYLAFTAESDLPGITGTLVIGSFFALGSGIIIARFLTRFRWMAWLSYVGRNTLPVYVAHVLLVSTFTSLLLLLPEGGAVQRLAPVIPVLVAGGAVAASLGLWVLVRRVPVLGSGYLAPTWFSGRPPAPAVASRPDSPGPDSPRHDDQTGSAADAHSPSSPPTRSAQDAPPA
jgi:uncharacterized membrane protein YcfT